MLPNTPTGVERQLLTYPLYPDSAQQWALLNYWIMATERGIAQEFPTLPLLHYREALAKLNLKRFGDWFEEKILEESDDSAMAEYDALVDEFNAKGAAIKDEQDIQTARDIFERIRKTIYG